MPAVTAALGHHRGVTSYDVALRAGVSQSAVRSFALFQSWRERLRGHTGTRKEDGQLTGLQRE